MLARFAPALALCCAPPSHAPRAACRLMCGTPDLLSGCTVIQLKEKLRAAGLPVSGRKAELIERLALGTAAAPSQPAPAAAGAGVGLVIEACKQ